METASNNMFSIWIFTQNSAINSSVDGLATYLSKEQLAFCLASAILDLILASTATKLFFPQF
jgi:hypothetical protein